MVTTSKVDMHGRGRDAHDDGRPERQAEAKVAKIFIGFILTYYMVRYDFSLSQPVIYYRNCEILLGSAEPNSIVLAPPLAASENLELLYLRSRRSASMGCTEKTRLPPCSKRACQRI